MEKTLSATAQPLITAKEAVALSEHNTIEPIYIAKDIADEWEKVKGKDNSYFRYLRLLATLYEAGRIQGKREERRKRSA